MLDFMLIKMFQEHKYRYAIKIEYIGHVFHGWQIQKNIHTIQGFLQEIIYLFAQEKVVIYCSGRTDTGVNALCQVAHFDLTKLYTNRSIIHGLNFYIRRSGYSQYINILNAQQVHNNFHARFDCIARTYMYQFTTIQSIHSLHCLYINEQEQENLYTKNQLFLGRHDFQYLRSRFCSSKLTIRNILDIKLEKYAYDTIRMYITAQSFLHHQVRYMIGSILYQEIDDIFKVKPILVSPEPLYLYYTQYKDSIF